MANKAFAIALLGLLACQGRSPSFTSSRGVSVFSQGHSDFISKCQADEMETYLVENLWRIGYPETSMCRCLRLAEINVVDLAYKCFEENHCAGEQWDNMLMILDTGCCFTSAYVHELAHWLQQCVMNIYDPKHQDENVWKIVEAFPKRCDSI